MRHEFAIAMLCCASIIACSRDTLPETKTETPPSHQIFGTSPQEAVRNFFQHINAGEYSKAKALSTVDARKTIDGELGGFLKWADHVTNRGSIEKVLLGRATTRGEGGTVEFALLYRDGARHCGTAPVLKEGTSWKVGLVQDAACSQLEISESPLTFEEAQKRTMAEMRRIATAWESRATDMNTYLVGSPSSSPSATLSIEQLSAALMPTYIREMPTKDAWGTPYVLEIQSNGQIYVIRSLGQNARRDADLRGPANDPNADIIYSNGQFLAYPSNMH